MKNIHLVPTEKPSRLRIGDNGNFVLGLVQNSVVSKNDFYTNQHLYITSDEEIKEKDWTFDGENPYKWTKDDVEDCLYNPSSENYKGCKKIILTTDQDLIKDGVQAIDDEFLEWFVKNPSCEYVEIQCRYGFYAGQDLMHYKIIIPQEEPKDFLSRTEFDLLKQQAIEEEMEEFDKQETLEEAADIMSTDVKKVHPADSYIFKQGFLEGAKSDAARDYWFKQFKKKQ